MPVKQDKRNGAVWPEEGVMRWSGVLHALLLLAACSGPESTPRARPELTAAVQPQSEPYQAFVDQYCGLWNDSSGEYRGFNRAHVPSYLAYVEGIRALGAEVVSDFPFRVLGDEQLEPCWRVAAEVVGLAGSAADVARLLAWAKQVRLGGRRYATAGLAGRSVDGLGFTLGGLGMAAARLGESSPVTGEVVEFLSQCLEFGYWKSQGRLPPVDASWDVETQPDETESDLAYYAVVRSIDALGATVSSSAIAELVAYHARMESMPDWDVSLRKGEFSRVRLAIELATEIRRLGLEGFLRRSGAPI